MRQGRRAIGLSTLREGVVIIFSVLIALAVDSLWEERGDRGREASYLVALQSELDSLSAVIQDAANQDSTYLARTEAVLEVLRDDQPPTARTDSIASLVPLNYSIFNPPTGTLRLLATSDQSVFIRSEETRAALQAAEGQLVRTELLLSRTESETWALMQRYLVLMETLWDSNGQRPDGGPFPIVEEPPARTTVPLAVQRSSAELRGLLQHHLNVLQNRVGYLGLLAERIDDLREYLR